MRPFYLRLAGIILGAVFSFSLQAQEIKQSPSGLDAKSPTGIVVDTRGLVCAFCASSIEKKFAEFPQVSGVDVNLESRVVIVMLKPGTDLSDASVTTAILDSGYAVSGIRRHQESLEALKIKYKKGFGD